MTAADEEIRVLHAEDDPDLASLTATFLEREDERIAVETASDVSDALDRFAAAEFDCIVSDFDMPGPNGLEFLERVRETHQKLPFILFTGKGSEEIASDAISAGVTDYLQKQTGSEQYALLANRIRHAVEGYLANERIRQNELWTRTLLTHSPDFVFVVDGAGTISYASPAVTRVLGYDPEELEGMNAFAIVHPDDLEIAADRFAETIETPNVTVSVEFRAEHVSGGYRWLEVQGRYLPDSPVVDDVIVNARNVTDRKEREAEIEATIERYRALVEQNSAGIYAIRADEIVFANQRMHELTGYPEAELRSLHPLDLVADEDAAAVEAIIDRRLAGEASADAFTFSIVRKDGEYRPVWANGARVELDGDPALVVTVLDVTEAANTP